MPKCTGCGAPFADLPGIPMSKAEWDHVFARNCPNCLARKRRDSLPDDERLTEDLMDGLRREWHFCDLAGPSWGRAWQEVKPILAAVSEHGIASAIAKSGASSAEAGATHMHLIPGGHPGQCRPVLLTLSDGRNNLEKRLRETIDHLIQCEKTRLAVFVTDHWDKPYYRYERGSFDGRTSHGVQRLVVLTLTQKRLNLESERRRRWGSGPPDAVEPQLEALKDCTNRVAALEAELSQARDPLARSRVNVSLNQAVLDRSGAFKAWQSHLSQPVSLNVERAGGELAIKYGATTPRQIANDPGSTWLFSTWLFLNRLWEEEHAEPIGSGLEDCYETWSEENLKASISLHSELQARIDELPPATSTAV